MIVSFLATLTAITVSTAKTCDIASGCGLCHVTVNKIGVPGRIVPDGKGQGCKPCNTAAPDQTIAGSHDGIPKPRRGTGQGSSKLMADYQPPSTIGGPSRTGGSGTRLM